MIGMRQPPIPIESMQQTMQWHEHRTKDPGLAWLRDRLVRAVGRMNEAAAGSTT